MRLRVTCQKCGTAFTRPPSQAKTDNLFCSKRCNALFHAETRKIRTAEQFWAKVAVGAPEECWLWTAYRNPDGYGQGTWMGQVLLAHRIALSLVDGDFSSTLHVCHSCDNPPCCNPAHLWRGTNRDNQHDKIAKGRAVYRPLKGEQHPQARLTTAQIADIRASNEKRAILAERHGTSTGYVSALRSRGSTTWSDIPVRPRVLRTHCHKGHEYKLTSGGVRRICMICHAERNAAYRQRRKETQP